jgi:hypothetical protein
VVLAQPDVFPYTFTRKEFFDPKLFVQANLTYHQMWFHLFMARIAE